jgi:hypothetical protein
MNRKRALIALIAMAFAVTACAETKADTVGLKYGAGPIEGDHFEKVIDPGSGQVFVWNDKVVNIPINQRDYTFCSDVREDSDDEGCDTGPIKVTALGGAELAISGGVTFEIATGDEEVLRAFNEELCRKFDCADDEGLKSDGWAELLRVVMRGPIEDSLQEEVRGYSVDALYAGVPAEGESVSEEEALSTLTQVSDALASSLKETINEYAGGEFFCGPAYERSEPGECPDFEFIITEVTPSEEVKAAFDRNVASRQGVVDAQNEADAKVVKAEGDKEAADIQSALFSNPAYLAYLRALAIQECAKNNNCTLIVGADDAGVTIAPTKPSG